MGCHEAWICGLRIWWLPLAVRAVETGNKQIILENQLTTMRIQFERSSIYLWTWFDLLIFVTSTDIFGDVLVNGRPIIFGKDKILGSMDSRVSCEWMVVMLSYYFLVEWIIFGDVEEIFVQKYALWLLPMGIVFHQSLRAYFSLLCWSFHTIDSTDLGLLGRSAASVLSCTGCFFVWSKHTAALSYPWHSKYYSGPPGTSLLVIEQYPALSHPISITWPPDLISVSLSPLYTLITICFVLH